MITPAGRVVVVRVFGDVDRTTEHVVQAALIAAWARRPGYVVVDVAGMRFCSVRGLTLLMNLQDELSGVSGARSVISGAPERIERILDLLWPAAPARYSSAAAAVLAAMPHQREQHDHVTRVRRPTPTTGPAPRLADDPNPTTEDELTERARCGDIAASRELARRHRVRMYRSALQMLGSTDTPEDVADDIATRLRTALTAFSRTDPG